jgi:hypothetical protein
MRALPLLAIPILLALGCSDSSDPAGDDVGDDEHDHPALDAGDVDPELDASTEDAASATDAAPPPKDAGPAKDAGIDGCALVTPPSAPYLLYGLHPDASNALRHLGFTASRISQTIGNAAASAGTHAQDGTAGGHPYSAATDLRVVGLTTNQIAKLLDDLASVGYAGWYRRPGYDGWPASEAPHIHAVWVGAPMKLILRNQLRDWIVGKNGLASHTTYTFHTWPQCRRDAIWKRFLLHNPAKN